MRESERGVSLLEALVASALVITVTSSVAQLIVWSRRAAWSAGIETTAVRLAALKLEQLRGLPWHVDAAGTLVSDDTTNLSTEPPAANGGGLQPSPAGTLDRNTPGFMDYVGADGRWRGSGGRAPAGAAFVRRWSVVPLESDAAHSLILTVVFVPLADAPRQRGRPLHGARLQTITTRTVR
jgi:hypothetical protein